MHAARRLALTARRLAVVAACAVATAALTAAPAQAEDGTLSGVVTAAGTGKPLAGVDVSVHTLAGPENDQHLNDVASGQTDAEGRYSIGGIPAGGQYRVNFHRDEYLTEWAHDHDYYVDAQDVVVPGTLDESLAPEARVSGRIVDENGQPVTEGNVSARRDDASPIGGYGWEQIGADGEFTITNLAPGAYTLSVVTPGRLEQYFHGTFLKDKRIPVVLSAGDNTADEKLLPKPAGVVQGTIKDRVTGKPVKGICVSFLGMTLERTMNQVVEHCTGADGKYAFTGIATQDTELSISDEQSRYVGATVAVSAQDGATVTRDVALARETRVSAKLIDGATGKPLPANSLCLEAQPADDTHDNGYNCNDRAGGAVAVAVPHAGPYVLMARPENSTSDRYGFGWVQADGTVTSNRSTAMVVTAKAGQTVAAGTVKAVQGGSISGRITSKATGKPLGRACIGVDTYDPRAGEFHLPGVCTEADADGRYTIHGLAPGGWPLNIASWEPTAWFYSGGAALPENAKPIAVTAGKRTTYNVAVSPGKSTLTGTITIPGETGYDLDVFNADSHLYVHGRTGDSLTGGTGHYEVKDIAPQRVKISYYSNGRERWYGGKDFASAKVVTLKPGTTTVNITAN